MLHLHITEAHDVLFRAQVEQQERVYCCLVRGCKKRFKAVNERRQHLQHNHKFTNEYAILRPRDFGASSSYVCCGAPGS